MIFSSLNEIFQFSLIVSKPEIKKHKRQNQQNHHNSTMQTVLLTDFLLFFFKSWNFLKSALNKT